MSDLNYAILIPELAVTNCAASLQFYCDVLGFTIVYERKNEGFAFLELDGAQLMLDQIDKGRMWTHPDALLEKPFGSGVNLQIRVKSVAIAYCHRRSQYFTVPAARRKMVSP